MWTDEERLRLRKLGIDPYRHTPDDLRALIDYFGSDEPSSLYSVYRKGVPVKASRDFARKVRRLTESRELDWLISTGKDQLAISLALDSEDRFASLERETDKTDDTPDRHLTAIRWLATQVIDQTKWDLMQLARGEDVDSQEYLEAAAGRSTESSLIIESDSRTTSISLVVEKYRSFSLLIDHLSTVVPLSEAPDSWDKALSRTVALAADRESNQDNDEFGLESAARVERIPVPVSTFGPSLDAWKKQLAVAVDISRVLNKEILKHLRDYGDRLIEVDDLASAKEGIAPRFTQTLIAIACGRQLPSCDARQVREGEYERAERSNSHRRKPLFELRWYTPQDRSYALAVSSSKERIEELKALHRGRLAELERDPHLAKLVRGLKQVDIFERRMRDAVESALSASYFPGQCQQCR